MLIFAGDWGKWGRLEANWLLPSYVFSNNVSRAFFLNNKNCSPIIFWNGKIQSGNHDHWSVISMEEYDVILDPTSTLPVKWRRKKGRKLRDYLGSFPKWRTPTPFDFRNSLLKKMGWFCGIFLGDFRCELRALSKKKQIIPLFLQCVPKMVLVCRTCKRIDSGFFDNVILAESHPP